MAASGHRARTTAVAPGALARPAPASTHAQQQQQQLGEPLPLPYGEGFAALAWRAGAADACPADHQACFEAAVARHGLSVVQCERLLRYLDYMLEVNQVMNLTAVRDRSEALTRHLVDSLALLPVLSQHPPLPRPSATASGAAGGDPLVRAAPAAAPGPGGPSRVAAPRQSRAARRRGEPAGQAAGGGAALPAHGAGVGEVSLSQAAPQQAAAEDGRLPSPSPQHQHHQQEDPEQNQEPWRVLDVGTGSGLPGMVLAAARPQWRVTLLDSLRKRCDFLQRAAEQSGLSNVEVVWARAEGGAHRPDMREAYDVVVARAVADTRVLAELCLPYVRRRGVWVAPKGPDPEAEVEAAAKAIQVLGGAPVSLSSSSSSPSSIASSSQHQEGSALLRVESYAQDGRPRTVLVVRKARSTPSAYPRAPGTPNKAPL